MKSHGFYDKPPYQGRETAIASLNVESGGNGPGGIRLGNFLQIRGELGNGLQEIFANKASVQQALDEVVDRGDKILRRFEQTYKGTPLP